MATTSTPPQSAPKIRTAHCIVTFGTRFIELENRDTGNGMRLNLPLSWDWDMYKGLDGDLISKLRQPRTFNVVELTATEMKQFKALCEGESYDPIAAMEEARKAKQAATVTPTLAQTPPTPAVQVKANAPTAVVSASKVLSRIAPQDAHDEALTTASLDGAEARLRGLRSTLEAIPEDGYFLLIYDIPDVLQSVCPNPCRILWRHGFPVNLSGRIMRADRMKHPTIVELFSLWDEHSTERYGYDDDGRPLGVEYYPIPIPEMTQQLKSLCRQKIDRELVRLHRALIKNIDSADRALAELIASEETTAQQVEEGEDTRNNKVRANIKKATEGLKATIECAEQFDEKGNLADLFKALREVIATQAITFNERVAARGRKRVAVPPPVA